jgi:hypothetical protein
MKKIMGIFLLAFLAPGLFALGKPEESIIQEDPENLIVETPRSPKYKLYLSKTVNRIIPILQENPNSYWELTRDPESADALFLPAEEINSQSRPWVNLPILAPRYAGQLISSQMLFLPWAIAPKALYVQGRLPGEEWQESQILEIPEDTESLGNEIEEELLLEEITDEGGLYNLDDQPELFFSDFILRLSSFHPPSEYLQYFARIGISDWAELLGDAIRLKALLQAINDHGVKSGYAYFPPKGPVLDRLLAREGRIAFLGGFAQVQNNLRFILQESLAEGETFYLQWMGEGGRMEISEAELQAELMTWLSQDAVQSLLFEENGLLYLSEPLRAWDEEKIPQGWKETFNDLQSQIFTNDLELEDFTAYAKVKEVVDDLYLGSLTVEEALGVLSPAQ